MIVHFMSRVRWSSPAGCILQLQARAAPKSAEAIVYTAACGYGNEPIRRGLGANTPSRPAAIIAAGRFMSVCALGARILGLVGALHQAGFAAGGGVLVNDAALRRLVDDRDRQADLCCDGSRPAAHSREPGAFLARITTEHN